MVWCGFSFIRVFPHRIKNALTHTHNFFFHFIAHEVQTLFLMRYSFFFSCCYFSWYFPHIKSILHTFTVWYLQIVHIDTNATVLMLMCAILFIYHQFRCGFFLRLAHSIICFLYLSLSLSVSLVFFSGQNRWLNSIFFAVNSVVCNTWTVQPNNNKKKYLISLFLSVYGYFIDFHCVISDGDWPIASHL